MTVELAPLSRTAPTSLASSAEGAYQVGNGVDTPVVLKLNSLDVRPTTFDGWSAIQAEATDTGFAVLWQATNGDYTMWETDTDWQP